MSRSKKDAAATLTSAQRTRIAKTIRDGLSASGRWPAQVCKMLATSLKGAPVGDDDREHVLELVKPRDKSQKSRVETILLTYAKLGPAIERFAKRVGGIDFWDVMTIASRLRTGANATSSIEDAEKRRTERKARRTTKSSATIAHATAEAGQSIEPPIAAPGTVPMPPPMVWGPPQNAAVMHEVLSAAQPVETLDAFKTQLGSYLLTVRDHRVADVLPHLTTYFGIPTEVA